MSEGVLELTDDAFDGATKTGVVLVDFWAPWCGPCRMQGPIIETLAKKVAGKATVAKLNVDDNTEAAARLGIQSIPTLILFKDGKEHERFVGVQSEADLLKAIDAAKA